MLRLRISLVLLAALPVTLDAHGAEPPARVQVLPGGGAWIERQIPLDADGSPAAAEVGWELSPALVPRSVSARLGERAIPLRLLPPLPAGVSFIEGCLDQEIDLLPAGSAGGLPAMQAAGARLIGAQGALAQLALADGSVVSVAADRVRCHPLRGSRSWAVRTAGGMLERPGALRLSYLLRGWSWSAIHRLLLTDDLRSASWETSAQLQVPEDLRFDEASISLLEGDVPDAFGGSPILARARSDKESLSLSRGDFAAPQHEGVGELTVYQLDDVIRPGGRQLLLRTLRPAIGVKTDPLLVLSGPSPFHGTGDVTRLDARLELRLANPDEVPRPAGVLVASAADASGRQTVLGSVNVPRTAPGGELRLALGSATGLDARWRRTALEQLTNSPFRKRARIEIELTNRREHAARVVLEQTFGGAYRLDEAKPAPSEKRGASAVFKLEIPPGGRSRISILASGAPARRRWACPVAEAGFRPSPAGLPPAAAEPARWPKPGFDPCQRGSRTTPVVRRGRSSTSILARGAPARR